MSVISCSLALQGSSIPLLLRSNLRQPNCVFSLRGATARRVALVSPPSREASLGVAVLGRGERAISKGFLPDTSRPKRKNVSGRWTKVCQAFRLAVDGWRSPSLFTRAYESMARGPGRQPIRPGYTPKQAARARDRPHQGRDPRSGLNGQLCPGRREREASLPDGFLLAVPIWNRQKVAPQPRRDWPQQEACGARVEAGGGSSRLKIASTYPSPIAASSRSSGSMATISAARRRS